MPATGTSMGIAHITACDQLNYFISQTINQFHGIGYKYEVGPLQRSTSSGIWKRYVHVCKLSVHEIMRRSHLIPFNIYIYMTLCT